MLGGLHTNRRHFRTGEETTNSENPTDFIRKLQQNRDSECLLCKYSHGGPEHNKSSGKIYSPLKCSEESLGPEDLNVFAAKLKAIARKASVRNLCVVTMVTETKCLQAKARL